ncbi:cation transporter [Tsuneonella sp. YG55]|uniref:Cation transporter n=1 Tax=Tsuneonella litorea TaxID=2976475 RepID=A0A9X2W5M9_9SPHN|nr:cation transporter [Tsuneonella litorea]MCT2559976.1 cation transporter [Tsuneonella litorea]
MSELPSPIRQDFRNAKRLEWWTLGWMSTVVVIMYLTMGASQAMKTAFFEDILGLIPAITFLVSAHLEPRAPTRKFPFGYLRANSLAFFASAVVLCFMGIYLIWTNGTGLMKAEHPTIPPVTFFGETFWLGWLMIAALAYSIVPPVILGRLKQPIARRLRDKVLFTDSLMQKADWQTGAAGIAGIAGIALGLWWADSLAALLIAIGILKDGIDATRSASAELVDGAPRRLEGNGLSEEAVRLQDRLEKHWPDGTVRIRESGRYLFATVDGVVTPGDIPSNEELMGDDPTWRLGRLSFTPPGKQEPGSGW